MLPFAESNLNSVSVISDDHSLDSYIKLYKIHIIFSLSANKIQFKVGGNLECIYLDIYKKGFFFKNKSFRKFILIVLYIKGSLC